MLDHPLYRRDPIAPQSLVLELLLAEGDGAVPVAHLLAAAALFDISENHIRVTLARLTAVDMVVSPRRGLYQLGSASKNLATDVAQWRQARQRLRPWSGDFVAVFSPQTLSADKTAQRQHARALHLLGFAPWGEVLHLRPDNLEPSLPSLRQRLLAVGLHPESHVFCAREFSPADQQSLAQLWDGKALNRGYQASETQLAQWLERAPTLELGQAARESLVLGGAAIRQLIFDPLLPAPLVDEASRNRFMDAAIAFDAHGRAIWKEFFAVVARSGRPNSSTPAVETTP